MSNKKKQQLDNILYVENTADKIIRVLICIIVGFIPILVYGKLQNFFMPVIEDTLNFSTTAVSDFFTYYKLMFLLTITIVLLVIFLINLFLRNTSLKASSLDIPILIFVLSLSITVLLTDHKTFAVWGGYTRNLGAATYLACALILYLLINLHINAKWQKMILNALYPVVIVNTVLILLAYYGINIWDVKVIAGFFTGGNPELLSESSRIYGTLNHYNYLSGMGAVLFAIFAARSIFSQFENGFSIELILSIIAAVMGATIVFASKSLSGMVTMVLITVLLIGLLFEGRFKKAAPFFIILGLTAISWSVLILHDASFINDLKENAGLLLATAVFSVVLFIAYMLVTKWEKLNKKKLLISGLIVFILFIGVLIPVFPKVESAVTAELNRIDSDLIMQRLEKDEFDFPEAQFTWGTGRIYIWKETLELVAEKPFFGYGFDTLAFEFDQTDPAKIAAMESPSVIIEKPHNMYINMLYGAGIVGFLPYIAIILIVILKAVKALMRGTEHAMMIWPVLLGILAYLYQGLFNDPVQGMVSIFWAMLGLCYGLSVNEQVIGNES